MSPSAVRGRTLSLSRVFLLLVALLPLLFPPTVTLAQQLVDLQPSTSQLTPAFSPSQFFYSLLVPATTAQLRFTPTLDGGATLFAQWDNQPRVQWTSGQASPATSLAVPVRELQLTLVRPSLPDLNYVVNVARISVIGRNANLLGARINPTQAQRDVGVSLEQMVAKQTPETFSSQALLYRVELYANISEFQFSGWVDATANLNVTILQANLPPRTAHLPAASSRSPIVTLQPSEAVTLFANVTAEDGTKKNYVFEVTRQSPPPPPPSSTGAGDFLEASSSTGGGVGSGDLDQLAGATKAGNGQTVPLLLALFSSIILVVYRLG